MNADELYRRSQAAYISQGGPKNTSDLSPIISKLLTQHGFFDIQHGAFDGKRIIEAVMNGNIWMIKGLGEVRVKAICKWLDRSGYLKNAV